MVSDRFMIFTKEKAERVDVSDMEVFRENEIKANMLIAKAMAAAAFLILFCWLLNSVGVLSVSRRYVLPVFLAGFVFLIIPAAVCLKHRGREVWIKHMLLISVAAILAYLDSILTFNGALFIIIPVVLSCRYYSVRTTVNTAILSTALFALSAFCGAVINIDNPDLNFINESMGIYLRDVMLLSFLPRWIIFVFLSGFCCEVAKYGRGMVLKQNEISREKARVSTELAMAGRIQNEALPSVKGLGENPYRQFDLYAKMSPAKEVGGDFYDFFYPDMSHLALVIADVADKGIAASLYMMMSKTLLMGGVSENLSPGKVLETANRQLFMNSPKGMFVTVWLGILDLQSGELVTANAGHEYPYIMRKGGKFEILCDEHGFVLGGTKAMKFPEYRTVLNEGDTIFVYTDGVPEAHNEEGVMFETDRLTESLNRRREACMEELVNGVRDDISAFSGSTPQFDDVTMLAFRMSYPKR